MKLLQNRVLKTAISTQLGGSLMIVIEALPQFPFLSNFNEKSLGKRKNELPFPFLSAHYSKTRFFVQYLFVLWETITIFIVSSNGLKWPQKASNGLKWPKMTKNGFTWPQVASNGLKWPRWPLMASMASDGVNGIWWPQMASNSILWPQMASVAFNGLHGIWWRQ